MQEITKDKISKEQGERDYANQIFNLTAERKYIIKMWF